MGKAVYAFNASACVTKHSGSQRDIFKGVFLNNVPEWRRFCGMITSPGGDGQCIYMRTSIDYLNEALKLIDDRSDAKKALELGIAKQTLSNYLRGERIMDDYACVLVAKTIGLNPMLCISSANYEREKNEEKKQFWLDLWDELNSQISREN